MQSLGSLRALFRHERGTSFMLTRHGTRVSTFIKVKVHAYLQSTSLSHSFLSGSLGVRFSLITSLIRDNNPVQSTWHGTHENRKYELISFVSSHCNHHVSIEHG